MGKNTILNFAQQDDYSKFMDSKYWKEEFCNPNMWTYAPHNYDVPGAKLVGPKHMVLWSDVKGDFNLGRKKQLSTTKLKKIKRDIRRRGIWTDCAVAYYDVDTGQLINAAHRKSVSVELDILGWMMQGVSFENDTARIAFANRSNYKREDVHDVSSVEDIKAAVRDMILLEDSEVRTNTDIKNMVKFLGKESHETKALSDISNEIIFERQQSGGNLSGSSRFQEWSATLVDMWIERSNDAWIKDVYENDAEESLYFTTEEFEARVGSIISASQRAKMARKPLHFLVAVPIHIGKSLETTRKEVFSDRLLNLERRICNGLNLDHKEYSKEFSWNHPGADHRFMPQDAEKDDRLSTIRLKDLLEK